MCKKKRILIFTFYNNEGKAYGYIRYLLVQFRTVADYIIFVVNGSLCSASREKIGRIVDRIIIRKNEGYDGEAYREVVLELIRKGQIHVYDELILSNDTYYGPFCSWSDIFEATRVKTVDFWGLTKWNEGYGELLNTNIPEHIQGYFVVVGKRMLHSQFFEEFWETMPLIRTYQDAVANYEIAFTRYFARHGFTYAAWLGEIEGNDCIYIKEPYKIIKEYNFPIIKRKAVSVLNAEGIKAVEYIKDCSNYDIKMIQDHKRGVHENPLEMQEIIEFCKAHTKIYVYGYGKWAKNLTYFLDRIGIGIEQYIVTECQGEENSNIVISYSHGMIKDNEGLIIAIRDFKEVYDMLKNDCTDAQILRPYQRICEQNTLNGGTLLKVAIWGTGKYWKNRKKYILLACDVVCLVDNNSDKWGSSLDGINIIPPDELNDYDFDYIAIMCKAENEVREQLNTLGVASGRILNYDELKCVGMGSCCVRYGEHPSDRYDAVIITAAMNYSGGPIAAVYAAKAMQNNGKRVLLCTENCDEVFLQELIFDGLEIMIAPALPCDIPKTLTQYIEECDAVLVNVFPMLPIACQLNERKPVLWWIHEASDAYEIVLQEFPQYGNNKLTSNIRCIAVSGLAQKNFEKIYYKEIQTTMAYGIPDTAQAEEKHEKSPNKITFAIIGSVNIRKAQDIFVSAIEHLEKEERGQAEFYIIGSFGKNEFCENIKQRAERHSNIHITGNLTRAEMEDIYPQMDVVVCPSREDPLPIVMTEAMMYRKPCIASDSTGTADYIKDGINGFVCKTEDANDLCEKMRYFIHHPEKIETMGQEARKVYEEHFTMGQFADRLSAEIQETIREFNGM